MAVELKKTSLAALRRFMYSEAGQDLLHALDAHVPAISSSTPHEIMFGAGKAQGYRDCVKDIMEIAFGKTDDEPNLENPGLE